jgi:DNA-binding LytR/AlgR family response regulator
MESAVKNINFIPTILLQPVKNIHTKKDKTVLIAGTVIFIILFLNLFSPFGINNSEGDIFFIGIQSGYGLLAGMVLFLFEFGIKRKVQLLHSNTVPIWQILCWYVVVTFVMAITNYSYYSLLKTTLDQGNYQFPSKSFPFFLWTTYLVAIVLSSGFWLYFRSQYKRKEVVHIKNTIVGKKSDGSITLWSSNRKESFMVDLRHLLFLEKRDNYVVIYYEKGASIEKQLLRTSMKDLEESIRFPLTRCHLSYIVNLERVIERTGNSKGLKLFMEGYSQPVPVSSKYYGKIIDELNRLSLSAPIAS